MELAIKIFYLVYPQLNEEVLNYVMSGSEIRHSPTAEFTAPIRQMASAELINIQKWMIPADKLFNKLTYSNLALIPTIDNPIKRAFYEMETIRGCWSYKELGRQISSLYYERSGLSKNKEALSALVQQQAVQLQPTDVINTPITLEFLGLNERALVTENDLEQSIIDNLQNFLIEMGHGFCFEARQKRILIDEDYFFADLVFNEPGKVEKKSGESISTFSASVPRPAFEIIKVGEMWVKRKMQKSTAI